ncbi:MAG: group II truncated hemoglobin [Halioglobus sp.]
MITDENSYGVGENSYRAAGKLPGIIRLVEAFYTNMDNFPEARKIRQMHGAELAEVRQKLAYFLSGWLGGPRLFSEHYGAINIPGFHKKFRVGKTERDAWLLCMKTAIDDQPYQKDFKEYLLAQLKIPAERVRQAGSFSHEQGEDES